MTGTSIAVAAYFARPGNRGDVGTGRGIVAPVAAAVLLGAVLAATVDQFDVLIGVAETSATRWLLPSLFAVAAVLGAGWALILRTKSPAVYAALGTTADRS